MCQLRMFKLNLAKTGIVKRLINSVMDKSQRNLRNLQCMLLSNVTQDARGSRELLDLDGESKGRPVGRGVQARSSRISINSLFHVLCARRSFRSLTHNTRKPLENSNETFNHDENSNTNALEHRYDVENTCEHSSVWISHESETRSLCIV